jgi:hypothetical protein
LLPLLKHQHRIPKKANTIIVEGVTFEKAINTLRGMERTFIDDCREHSDTQVQLLFSKSNYISEGHKKSFAFDYQEFIYRFPTDLQV